MRYDGKTCWECSRLIENNHYRSVKGIETGWREYRFCSLLCLLSWATPFFLSFARSAEKKRINIDKKYGEQDGSVKIQIKWKRTELQEKLNKVSRLLMPIQMELSAFLMLAGLWLARSNMKKSRVQSKKG